MSSTRNNNPFFEKYLRLIQSYIEKNINNPFIIFILFCQHYQSTYQNFSLFCHARFIDQSFRQRHKLPHTLPSSLDMTASLTEQEDSDLRNLFSDIKFPKQLALTEEFVNLLGIFFLYFPGYIQSIPENKGEIIHRMMIFNLNQLYPIKSLSFELFNDLISRNLFFIHDNPIQSLKRSISVLTNQQWLQILTHLKRQLATVFSLTKSKIVTLLATLADDIPGNFRDDIIKTLFSYLNMNDTALSNAASFALERFSYVISKEQRTYCFKTLLKDWTKLKPIQIKLLGTLIETLNKDESLLAVNLLCKKTLCTTENVRIQAVESLGNLPSTIKKMLYNQIIHALFSSLMDTSLIQEHAVRSLAKIASISTYEQRKMIINYLYHYFTKSRRRENGIFETLNPLDPNISNEKIEIALMFLLEHEYFNIIEIRFLAVFSKNLINILCSQLIDKKNKSMITLQTIGRLAPLLANNQPSLATLLESLLQHLENYSSDDILDKKVILDLYPLIPIFSAEKKYILLSYLYKKLCDNEYISIFLGYEENIFFAKYFNIPISSEKNKIILKEIQKMLTNNNIAVKEEAVSYLSHIILDNVDNNFIEIAEALCQSILVLNSSKRKLAIEMLDRFISYLSDEKRRLAIQTLRWLLFEKNEENTIIQAVETLKKLILPIQKEEQRAFISEISHDLCTHLLSAEQPKIKNQLVFTLSCFASVFSYSQRAKVMDSLFKYISLQFFSTEHVNTLITAFEQFLLHLTSFEKANLYVQLMMIQSNEIKGEFVPLIDQLYASLYELPKVIPSRQINNIIESYLSPNFKL